MSSLYRMRRTVATNNLQMCLTGQTFIHKFRTKWREQVQMACSWCHLEAKTMGLSMILENPRIRTEFKMSDHLRGILLRETKFSKETFKVSSLKELWKLTWIIWTLGRRKVVTMNHLYQDPEGAKIRTSHCRRDIHYPKVWRTKDRQLQASRTKSSAHSSNTPKIEYCKHKLRVQASYITQRQKRISSEIIWASWSTLILDKQSTLETLRTYKIQFTTRMASLREKKMLHQESWSLGSQEYSWINRSLQRTTYLLKMIHQTSSKR